MRKLFLLFALLLCMAGNGQTTIKWDYPVKPGSKEWKKLDSYSERLEKCQIPKDVLPHLDTPQLVDLCMEYPFLMNIYVFGDPFYGYDVLFDDFNGIRELFGREDAYECITNAYADMLGENYVYMKLKVKTPYEIGEYKFLVSFLELTLGNKKLIAGQDTESKQKALGLLTDGFEKLLETEEEYNHYYALANICARENIESSIKGKKSEYDYKSLLNKSRLGKLGYVDSLISRPIGNYDGRRAYTLTPNGSKVRILVDRQEFTQEYINSYTSYYQDIFPEAILLEPSTNIYNCHAYAWHMTEGGFTCWVGEYPEDEYIYMTDGSFIEVDEGPAPRKISYRNKNNKLNEHSAVATNKPGIVISKWGPFPLMEHKTLECPFGDGAELRYYIRATLFRITGFLPEPGRASTLKLNYNALNPTWTVSSNLQIISGQGTPEITVKVLSTGTGEISVYQGENLFCTSSIPIGRLDENLIEAQFGMNNTLYSYHPNRNECTASYKGNSSILEYDWESTDWRVSPQNANKSKVILAAKYQPISNMSTIKVRARNSCGWSNWKLFGCYVNNSMSSYSVKAENKSIEITRKEDTECDNSVNYSLVNQLSGNVVDSGKISGNGGTINASRHADGLYILTLTTESGEKIQSEKIILKQRQS